MLLDHPIRLSQAIASLLESDPIAVAQVKETIAAERLIELFGISRDDLPKYGRDERTFSEFLIDSDFNAEDALQYVINHYTKSEILEALGRE